MKTTGVLPEALAASISRFSRSEIDAIPQTPFSVAVESQATLLARLMVGSKLRMPSDPNLPRSATSTFLLLRQQVGHCASEDAAAVRADHDAVERSPR